MNFLINIIFQCFLIFLHQLFLNLFLHDNNFLKTVYFLVSLRNCFSLLQQFFVFLSQFDILRLEGINKLQDLNNTFSIYCRRLKILHCLKLLCMHVFTLALLLGQLFESALKSYNFIIHSKYLLLVLFCFLFRNELFFL